MSRRKGPETQWQIYMVIESLALPQRDPQSFLGKCAMENDCKWINRAASDQEIHSARGSDTLGVRNCSGQATEASKEGVDLTGF